jgi:hypothetical protein
MPISRSKHAVLRQFYRKKTQTKPGDDRLNHLARTFFGAYLLSIFSIMQETCAKKYENDKKLPSVINFDFYGK